MHEVLKGFYVLFHSVLAALAVWVSPQLSDDSFAWACSSPRQFLRSHSSVHVVSSNEASIANSLEQESTESSTASVMGRVRRRD